MPAADPLDEFKTLGKRDNRPPCKVAVALEQVEKKDRDRVRAALEHVDEDIRRGVKLWLQEREITPPSSAALTHHRARDCRCHA